MAYADDIAITFTHTSTSVTNKYIQPYLHKDFAWTKQSINKTRQNKFHSVHAGSAEYTNNLDLTINYKALPMTMHPKVLGLTLDPKPIYSTHIHNISVQAHKHLQIIKALTATGWGKQKRYTWLPTRQLWDWLWSMPLPYGRLLHPRPALTNCKSYKTQHWELPHDAQETLTLPIHEHLPLHASQYKQKTQYPSHPLHKHTTYFNTPRLKKNYF